MPGAVRAELGNVARMRLARQPPGNTSSATSLVHEVWRRMKGRDSVRWHSGSDFFAAAAVLMRNVLVARRFFVGMTIEEAAQVLEVSARTAHSAGPSHERGSTTVSAARKSLRIGRRFRVRIPNGSYTSHASRQGNGHSR